MPLRLLKIQFVYKNRSHRNYQPKCKKCGGLHTSRFCPNKRQYYNDEEINKSAKVARLLKYYPKCFNSVEILQDSKIWFMDSGATRHMCNNKNLFKNLENKSGQVINASGDKMEVSGIGEISLDIKDNNNITRLMLSDVLYVPSLDSNLVSVKRLSDKHNTKILFDNSKCTLFNNDVSYEIGIFDEHAGLYKLNVDSEKCLKTSTNSEYCIHHWHKMFSHRNIPDVKCTLKKLNIEYKKCKCSNICESCIEGKMFETPYPQIATSVQNVHDVCVTDICEMPVKSHGLNHHFMTMIDVRSRYCCVYFLRRKSDAVQNIINHIEWMKNQLHSKPRILRSDRGKEYLCNELQNYLASEGIKFECTVGYASSQNGIAERKNRTLVEAGNTSLIDSNLPKYLWAEAVATANYVQNRVTDSNTKETPYELYFNKPLDRVDFHIFGEFAYHRMPDAKRKNKLDSRAVKVQFVGYDLNSKGLRFYQTSTRKIYVSRSYKFLNNFEYPQVSTQNSSSQNKSTAETETFKPKISSIVIDSNDEDLDFKNSPSLISEFQNEEINVENNSNIDENLNESLNERILETDDVQEGSSILETDFIQEENSSLNQSSYEEHEKDINETRDHFVRRSERSNAGQPPERLSYKNWFGGVFVASVESEIYEPRTFKQSQKCDDKNKWMEAMKTEINSINKNKTWDVVDLPSNRKAIGCKWVYKVKYDEKNNPQYKARLVAQGFNQRYGVDFDEVFAPVAHSTTLRMLLSVAGVNNYKIKHYDVKSAFLNGKLDEEIYMKQPPGFENSDKVLKLKKSLYGLKQAANVWNKALNEKLLEQNFIASPHDPCLYFRRDSNNVCYILIHVDDILIVSNKSHTIRQVASVIGKHFEIKDLGEAKHYLAIDISKDKNNDIYISQHKYIEKIIVAAKLQDSKISNHPLDVGYLKTIDKTDQLPINNDYRVLIGMLNYLSTHSRPDISASVNFLAQRVSSPSQLDLTEVKRVVKYLKATKDLKLRLSDKSKPKQLVVYSDANHAECIRNRKSNSGYVSIFNGGTISWSCRKQTITTLSSTDSEYIAITEACKELIWLTNLSRTFGYSSNLPMQLKTDSQSCISRVKNRKSSNLSKHIDVKFHFIKQLVTEKKLNLTYVPTNDNIADLLTKPLGPTKIATLRQLAGLKYEK